MISPVVLDIDQSLGHFPGALVVPMRDWHERLRFACSRGTIRQWQQELQRHLPAEHGTVLFGSGDFHHLSWPLIERRAARGPFQVIVLDNHPDNMRFPLAVHCGSWVRRAAALQCVSHVHVVGITSQDIGRAHAWENYLMPLLRGRLTYWSTDVDVRWAGALGLARRFRSFTDIDTLVEAFVGEQKHASQPTYLSIDKDVLAADVVQTNWDQGRMRLDHIQAIIDSLRSGIIGSDINGEVSVHRYQSWWKLRLTAMDQQPGIPVDQLDTWRAQHHQVNRLLLDAIAEQMRNASTNLTFSDALDTAQD